MVFWYGLIFSSVHSISLSSLSRLVCKLHKAVDQILPCPHNTYIATQTQREIEMSIEQVRAIIKRDGLAHIPHLSMPSGTRYEDVYLTEVTENRVMGFVFDGHRKNFKRPINTKHDGQRFFIGGDSGKRKFKFTDVDPVHVDYLYDVVGGIGTKVNPKRTGCVSTYIFYGLDLNRAQAHLLCQQIRKSGLDQSAWTPSVGDYQRTAGRGHYWTPKWKQMENPLYNIQKLVD